MPSHSIEGLSDGGLSVQAAAIRIGGAVFTLPRPNRHHNIMWWLSALGVDAGDMHDQGFIASTGQFVSRTLAAKIALNAGQVEKLHAPPNLFSEDLWDGGADLPRPDQIAQFLSAAPERVEGGGMDSASRSQPSVAREPISRADPEAEESAAERGSDPWLKAALAQHLGSQLTVTIPRELAVLLVARLDGMDVTYPAESGADVNSGNGTELHREALAEPESQASPPIGAEGGKPTSSDGSAA